MVSSTTQQLSPETLKYHLFHLKPIHGVLVVTPFLCFRVFFPATYTDEMKLLKYKSVPGGTGEVLDYTHGT